MSSIRRLTSTELGLLRYEVAEQTNYWPVEVRVPKNPKDDKTTRYVLKVPDCRPIPFTPVVTGGWRASLVSPPEPLPYQVFRNDIPYHSGHLDVEPPQVPLARTKLTSALSHRQPSGIHQLDVGPSADGLWPVRVAYEEETWFPREVFIVVARKGQAAQTPLPRNAEGSFVATVRLPPGDLNFRFRVIPREKTRADAAPFTRLGWDEGASSNGVLVTWPLLLTVEELEDDHKLPGKEKPALKPAKVTSNEEDEDLVKAGENKINPDSSGKDDASSSATPANVAPDNSLKKSTSWLPNIFGGSKTAEEEAAEKRKKAAAEAAAAKKKAEAEAAAAKKKAEAEAAAAKKKAEAEAAAAKKKAEAEAAAAKKKAAAEAAAAKKKTEEEAAAKAEADAKLLADKKAAAAAKVAADAKTAANAKTAADQAVKDPAKTSGSNSEAIGSDEAGGGNSGNKDISDSDNGSVLWWISGLACFVGLSVAVLSGGDGDGDGGDGEGKGNDSKDADWMAANEWLGIEGKDDTSDDMGDLVLRHGRANSL